MNQQKLNMAIAILRSGRSFDEASKISGISVLKLIEAWNKK
jgi:hypothetical protein